MNVTKDTEATAEIQQILTDLDNLDPQMYMHAATGELFYLEPRTQWVRPASDFTDEVVSELRTALAGPSITQHLFAEYYSLDGRRIPREERPDGWYFDNLNLTPSDRKPHPELWNSIWRLGTGYLLVGRGRWNLVAETTLDGAPAFEFSDYHHDLEESMRAFQEELAERREAFTAKHVKAIDAIRPGWAENDGEPVDIEDGDDLDGAIEWVCEVTKSSNFRVTLDRYDTMTGGKFKKGNPEIRAYIGSNDGVDFADTQTMRDAARDLLAAADAIDARLAD